MGNEHSRKLINNAYEKRHIHKLSGKSLILQKLSREELKCQQKKLEILETSIIYPNQNEAAEKILNIFKDMHKLMVLALGLTQSGKTGVMCSCIQHFAENDENPVPVNNIFVITGLSSREWVKQTIERMPEILHKNIYHRDNLKKLKEDIKGMKNILILIDEIQIACGLKQTISKEFQNANLLDKDYLLDNDIKIIEFSATPNGNLYDYKKWGTHASKIRVFPGENYTGCIDLLKSRRIEQCFPLSGKYYNDKILTIINIEIEKFKNKRFLIFRTKTGENQEVEINNLRDYFGTEDFEYKTYDMDNLSEEKKVYDEINECYELKTEIDLLLEKEPLKHTFIFLKEKARCAKTFTKKYVGIWYERYTLNFGDDIITQGLLGRSTGYDDNGDSVIFTNIESVKKYKKLWESNFENSEDWVSNSTKTRRGTTISKGTFNAKFTKESSETRIDKPKIEKRNTKDEIIKTFKELGLNQPDRLELGKTLSGPRDNNELIDIEGFYICNTQYDKTDKRRTLSEFLDKEKTGDWRFCGKNNRFRVYPCYSDITDYSTVEWWLIYYELKK
jgi:hypothetical protein